MYKQTSDSGYEAALLLQKQFQNELALLFDAL